MATQLGDVLLVVDGEDQRLAPSLVPGLVPGHRGHGSGRAHRHHRQVKGGANSQERPRDGGAVGPTLARWGRMARDDAAAPSRTGARRAGGRRSGRVRGGHLRRVLARAARAPRRPAARLPAVRHRPALRPGHARRHGRWGARGRWGGRRLRRAGPRRPAGWPARRPVRHLRGAAGAGRRSAGLDHSLGFDQRPRPARRPDRIRRPEPVDDRLDRRFRAVAGLGLPLGPPRWQHGHRRRPDGRARGLAAPVGADRGLRRGRAAARAGGRRLARAAPRAPAARAHGDVGPVDHRRRPLPTGRAGRQPQRGRTARSGPQHDAGRDRGGVPRTRGHRAAPAPVPGRRLARVAHAAHVDPGLCRAVPGRRREVTDGPGHHHAPHRGRVGPHEGARRGSVAAGQTRRDAAGRASAGRPGRAGRRCLHGRRGRGPRNGG